MARFVIAMRQTVLQELTVEADTATEAMQFARAGTPWVEAGKKGLVEASDFLEGAVKETFRHVRREPARPSPLRPAPPGVEASAKPDTAPSFLKAPTP